MSRQGQPQETPHDSKLARRLRAACGSRASVRGTGCCSRALKNGRRFVGEPLCGVIDRQSVTAITGRSSRGEEANAIVSTAKLRIALKRAR